MRPSGAANEVPPLSLPGCVLVCARPGSHHIRSEHGQTRDTASVSLFVVGLNRLRNAHMTPAHNTGTPNRPFH